MRVSKTYPLRGKDYSILGVHIGDSLFRETPNCIGFRSGVLSDVWESFDRVSVSTVALFNVYLSGLDGCSGFRVYVGTMGGTHSSGPPGVVSWGRAGTRRVKTLNPTSPQIYWKDTTSLIGR